MNTPAKRERPMSSSLLITNADCINEDRRFEADLLIRDGRIDAIGGELEQPRCGAGAGCAGHR
jgi:dihydroorotase-like cyclic amidohydrolase